MLPKLQPVISVTFVLTLFVLNIHYPAFAETESKRRQRLVMFKLLSSSGDAQASTENVTSQPERFVTNGDLKLMPNNPDKMVKGKASELPLISGRNSKLPLTMMGKFKNTWCKTEPFMQLIKEPGCISRKIMNRFCYGQCNSFYIPRTIRKNKKKRVFKSCGFCKPRRTHTILVTLKCPGRAKGYKQKKVKQIKQCRCMER